MANITVNTLMDENDGIAIGGVSLRDAINAAAPNDRIIFDLALANQVVTLTNGELVINKPLIIEGDTDSNPATRNITVSGNNTSRVFNINDGDNATFQTVTIDGLTITGGVATGFFPSNLGGGIYNRESLTLSNSTLSGNSAAYFGGGIYNNDGKVSLSNSTLSGNSAGYSGGGGGIFNDSGTASLSNSTLSGNSAIYFGGGIYNRSGTASISNSTLSGNSASRYGGGIFNGSSGTASISNSTLSGNSANKGGGIFNRSGTASLSNSTLSGNSANVGGGIYNSFGTANVVSTIVAVNTAINPDVQGAFTDQGNNLIGNATGSTGFTTSALVGNSTTPIDPLLGPLQDNGGSTLTRALLTGSPAINAGSNPNGLTTDQRGTGFARVVGPVIDIGAFEAPLPPATSLVVDTIVDEDDGNLSPGDVSLREAFKAIAPNGTITFANSIANSTITLGLGELVVNKSVIINGDTDSDPATRNITVSGNGASRVFNINDNNSFTFQTVTIDGLTITGGVATGGFPSNLGGGIYNRENLTLSNSTLSGNSADNAGGGILNLLGTASISNSTLSGNSAYFGGGILNYYGTASLSNSTVSGNSANFGGGIYNRSGTASLSNSTLSGNSANVGGGIYNSFGTANVVSTIVAVNTATTSPDVQGAFTDQGNNLIGNATGSTGFTTSTLVGNSTTPIDPLLGPLQDNGGPTFTRALLTGSPATNTGSNPNGLTTDQRGTGFARVLGPVADIGAFEITPPPTSLVVDTIVDEDDGNLSPGDVSLREAFKAIAPNGTITFANSIANSTITLGLGELVVNKSVIINGDTDSDPATRNITVSGNGASRVFNINDGNAVTSHTVTIDGLTITGGVATGVFPSNLGGGIDNQENLTLSNSTLSGNSASYGGGISNRYGTASISNSTLSGNSASYGGGIYNRFGTASISNSTLSGNSARYGGGISNVFETASISNSTLSGNSAFNGGGIFNVGTASISNSTLSGNSSANTGGGIFNAGIASLSNSTLSGNSSANTGGGIFNSYGIANVVSTIVAVNTATTNPDVQGAFTDQGNNLIGNSTGSTGFTTSTLVGNSTTPINPLLGPLQNNGGPTLTRALLAGSPAINTGSNPNSLTTDQRGTGFDRVVGPVADIGAFESEFQNEPPVAVDDDHNR